MVSVPTTPETTTPEATTPVTAVVETKKARKAREAAEKKAAALANPPVEGAAPATPAVPAVPKGPTQRLRIFQLLAATPSTGREVALHLGAKSIPMILKDEGVCPTPRIQRAAVVGKKGVVYSLTAAGLAALEAGEVDENAAPSSPHLEWPGLPSGKAELIAAQKAAKAEKAAKAAKAATTVPVTPPPPAETAQAAQAS